MKQRILGLSAVILAVLLLSPLAQSSESDSRYPIPDGVLASADEYVISKVGQALFDSCITWSPGLSCHRPLDPDNVGRSALPDWIRWPRYVIIYKLRVPGRPFVDETILVNIREDGGWFEDVAHDEGLPDCVSDPGECDFPIDETSAIEIARGAGLQQTKEPWRTDFRWSGRTHRTYIWEVRNELAELRGELVFIDANDGTVLGLEEWFVRVQGHPPTAP